MNESSTDLIRAVAAYGLACTATELPIEPLPPDTWRRLLELVASQRLAGFLAAAVVEGALAVTEDQQEQALESHVAAMCSALKLEALLLDTVALLTDAGLDHRVLKGSAVAHLDYADPALRSFGDIDLMVESDAFDEAVRVLCAQGHRRRFPQPRPGFDRRFSKGTSFTTVDGFEIDLHRTFLMGPFGLQVNLPDIWSEHTEFVLAGRSLRALAPHQRFLHACLHAALGDSPPRLSALRDVGEMVVHGTVDVPRVRELSSSWHADAALSRAVSLTWELFQLGDANELTAWALRYQPDEQERRFLRVYLEPGRSYAGKSLAALQVVPGLANKMAYVWALAFPKRSYVAERHGHHTRRWRRAAGALRQSGRP